APRSGHDAGDARAVMSGAPSLELGSSKSNARVALRIVDWLWPPLSATIRFFSGDAIMSQVFGLKFGNVITSVKAFFECVGHALVPIARPPLCIARAVRARDPIRPRLCARARPRHQVEGRGGNIHCALGPTAHARRRGDGTHAYQAASQGL